MNWFVFSLLSIGALATAELTQQHILNSKSKIDEYTTTVITLFIEVLLVTPFIFILNKQNELMNIVNFETFPLVLFGSLMAAIGSVFYFKSFKVKNISISAIFISLSVVVSTTLGIVLFDESIYITKLFGILLIFIAIAVLNYKNLQLERNHLYGLLVGIFFGIAYAVDKLIVTDYHPIVYIFWGFLFVGIFSFLIRPLHTIKVIRKLKLNDYKPVLYSAIGYLLYNFFTFVAYRLGGEVGRIDAINNSQFFLIILVEYFVFKQTDGFYRKILTATIAFAGVMILGYF